MTHDSTYSIDSRGKTSIVAANLDTLNANGGFDRHMHKGFQVTHTGLQLGAGGKLPSLPKYNRHGVMGGVRYIT